MKIQTPRLLIVPPRERDIDFVFRQKSDSEGMRFTGGVTKLSFIEYKREYDEKCRDFDEKKPGIYSVINRETDQYIGYCGFSFCRILDGTEILYGYAKEHWGRGYALEAAKAVLSYGFETFDLDEIVAAVNPLNPASEKILKKIGLKLRGTVEWPEQGIVNRYALTKAEWICEKNQLTKM